MPSDPGPPAPPPPSDNTAGPLPAAAAFDRFFDIRVAVLLAFVCCDRDKAMPELAMLAVLLAPVEASLERRDERRVGAAAMSR